MIITQKELKEIFDYDPDSGNFIQRTRTSNRMKIGDVAGSLRLDGYRGIMIGGKLYFAHRLAWLYVHGEWPPEQIDHRNGSRADNRIANLRLATSAENHQNWKKRSNNSSGYIGVFWDKEKNKWRAGIRVSGKRKHLGSFTDPAGAHDAYLVAKKELHQYQPIPREYMEV